MRRQAMLARSRAFTLALAIAAGGAAAARADNVLDNPEFDHDPFGWSISAGNSISRGTSDADGCAASGNLQVVSSDGPGAVARAVQCAPVAAGTMMRAHAKMAMATDMGALGRVIVEYYRDADCTEAQGSSVTSSDVTLATPYAEVTTGFFAVPADAVAARFSLEATLGPPFTLRIDRTFLGPAADVFGEGFEVGALCRWAHLS